MSGNNPFQASTDPQDFMRQFWGGLNMPIPGMVTPTLDTDELDKRIADLKAVEGWLKMNLNMLHMSIQGMEMQKMTLAAMQSMSQSGTDGTANSFASAAMNPALWPWNFMNTNGAAAHTGTQETPAASEEAEANTTNKKKP